MCNCLKSINRWLGSIFKPGRDPGPSATSEPAVQPAAPLVIPHPEEPPDFSRTVANTSREGMLADWFKEWKVTEQHQAWWLKNMTIHISTQYPNPAQVYSRERQMWIRPEWTNPGVVAHELARVSFALLSAGGRSGFTRVYTPLKTTDPLIKLLYSQNSYGLTSDVEGHAEVYRYLGEKCRNSLNNSILNSFNRELPQMRVFKGESLLRYHACGSLTNQREIPCEENP